MATARCEPVNGGEAVGRDGSPARGSLATPVPGNHLDGRYPPDGSDGARGTVLRWFQVARRKAHTV